MKAPRGVSEIQTKQLLNSSNSEVCVHPLSTCKQTHIPDLKSDAITNASDTEFQTMV